MSIFNSIVDGRRLAVAVALGAAAALAAGSAAPALAAEAPASADPMLGMPSMDMSGMQGTAETSAAPAPSVPARGPAVFLTAELSGAQEVPVPGGPAAGAPKGKASALVEVKGDRVTFGFTWQGISAPTLGHIHQGVAGVDGPVKVPLFGTAMPDTVSAAAGQVSVTDPVLAQSLRTDPGEFNVNLHTKEFPGGAVRGQLTSTKRHGSVLSFIHGGNLRSIDTGNQEVPVAGASKTGDPDGVAAASLDAHGSTVGYSFAWINIAPPTLGHVHEGGSGLNGAVKVPLFGTPVPANIFAITGAAQKVDPALVEQIRHNPNGFYTNLHTTEFPGGAVRGQLF
jgi:hypothetical protein